MHQQLHILLGFDICRFFCVFIYLVELDVVPSALTVVHCSARIPVKKEKKFGSNLFLVRSWNRANKDSEFNYYDTLKC